MIACVDVSYGEHRAAAACVLLRSWEAEREDRAHLAHLDDVAPYQPGAFYLRELPCILAVLRQVEVPLTAIVIDGYVWLSSDGRPGLGARLFDALDDQVPVVGVAKTSFHGADDFAIPLLRGQSKKPLHVTAVGTEPANAAAWVQRMHGPHRIPTMLQRVDWLCRQANV
ncbi:endonuclease V [Chondromyces crocatus]|uniref:Endonuclease V n=1 Tax=Chondromyces crocatus TaxID=52 RepID=A0A0K1EK08_CHOCO|nr:endonuclease V [Chondromyces crocatus]AKT41200.1 endonuclease V [Chondromyces crocatus]